jgi:hypothetical protein
MTQFEICVRNEYDGQKSGKLTAVCYQARGHRGGASACPTSSELTTAVYCSVLLRMLLECHQAEREPFLFRFHSHIKIRIKVRSSKARHFKILRLIQKKGTFGCHFI